MARPRKFTDEHLLDAAGVAIGRLGPGFTLADVAREAGVAVGTLAQRFGSKHGLLAAMTRTAVTSTREGVRTASATADDPVAAVIDVLVETFAALDDPARAANNLAQLAVDLADEELRGLLAELHAALEEGLVPLLDRAVGEGRLPGAPPAPVAARVLAAIADGTALHWSARPVGGLRDRMRTDLGAVLTGWCHGPDAGATEESM
ncbi:TetR family transcriptional regulator [Actinoallomurus purpureus]|uniref:TetR family transcriptional regulator n=1 Tax=Actinoallomurus purpureus TaxID=478114 RepID=UPI0020928458|nr:TetR/AcrR family transcriptional regulator [Actinoallomurus purpureus]MCO6010864.1 TetR family transcriptional regulator [Actinoallomurus purpureus]